jgi:GTP-binding protein
MADIPGLIEGAHLGKGLGHRFLRHIERTRLIVILIETPEPNYTDVFKELVAELTQFSPALAALPRMVVRSKSDLPRPAENRSRQKFDLVLSGVSGEGLSQFTEVVYARLQALPN